MKKELLCIIDKYLELFPEEQERQSKLVAYLNSHNDTEYIDWNNFNGHLVAGGFIYAKEEKKFLVLYHKDLQMYLYPGGHIDINDKNPLEAAKREVLEETGLSNLELLNLKNEDLIPIDIDTHLIDYNERLDLPEHHHFDFRYLFTIDKIESVNINTEELENYKWIDINDLSKDKNYGNITRKIKSILKKG